MEVNEELVRKLCELSALEYKPEESLAIRQDLERMLAFVDKINEVDTSNVEPLIHISMEVNRFRADEPQAPTSHEDALKNAPKRDSDFFRVPKVIDKRDA